MRAHGLEESVVPEADINEMFTTSALAAGAERWLRLPFYEVAGTVNFTAESA